MPLAKPIQVRFRYILINEEEAVPVLECRFWHKVLTLYHVQSRIENNFLRAATYASSPTKPVTMKRKLNHDDVPVADSSSIPSHGSSAFEILELDPRLLKLWPRRGSRRRR